jgi:hypothetical protein
MTDSTFEKTTGIEAPVINIIFLKNRTNEEQIKQIIIDNCVFKNNRATGQAQGAILYDSSSYESKFDVQISNSKFIDNYA